MEDCIFCKIGKKEIPSTVVYEDEHLLAFKDLNPVAPVHVLIIPKVHMNSLNAVTPDHVTLMGHLLSTVKTIARECGIPEGYRLVSNCGIEAGQTVEHLHFHLVGGRPMQWPPG